MLQGIFLTIVNMSIIGGLAILLVLLVRLPLSKAPKVFSYCLWAVVLFRLLVPFSFESVVSLIPVHKQPIPLNLASMQTPAIDTGIQVVDKTVSAALPTATVAGDASALPMVLTAMETIWLAVMLAMLGFGLYSLLKLKYKLRTATLLEGNIYQCGCVDTPFVLGILKPRIYLPTGLKEIECEYILLHEQNHIRRGDHVIRILGYLALCIHWFNPLVWIAFRASGKDMEMANDESVIRRKGESIKKEYSSSLLALSTGRRRVSPVPLAFGEEDPKGRIKNIINYNKPVAGVVLAAVVVVMAVSVGLLLSSDNEKANEKQIDLDKMNAGEIVSVLNNIGYSVGGGKNYDEPGDVSQYPWNIEGCTSAAEFWMPDGTEDGRSFGYVEVFSTVEACKTRRDMETAISSFYPAEPYYVQVGKVFLQVPHALTLYDAAQYQAALEDMAQGNMPEPPNDIKPTSQEVAAARSVVEEYFRACNEKDIQAILKTLTPEYNRPNTVLFGQETKTLLKIDYNPEDPMREWYITSGRGSVNDTRVENVIVFRVSFNIEYPEGVTGAWNEGKNENWSIILIRDDIESPWLIDDQGW